MELGIVWIPILPADGGSRVRWLLPTPRPRRHHRADRRPARRSHARRGRRRSAPDERAWFRPASRRIAIPDRHVRPHAEGTASVEASSGLASKTCMCAVRCTGTAPSLVMRRLSRGQPGVDLDRSASRDDRAGCKILKLHRLVSLESASAPSPAACRPETWRRPATRRASQGRPP